MKINKNLLAMKGHFFLRNAGSAPFIMLMPLIVRNKGLSSQVVGLLWSVLPVVGLIVNTILGVVADYFRAHRMVLLGSLLSLTVGILSTYWIPNIPLAAKALEEAHSLASYGNATLGFGALIDVNSSSLGLTGAGVDPEMVGEGQAPPLGLSNIEEVEEESQSFGALIHYTQFWLLFFSLMAMHIGISTCIPLADSVCLQILGSELHKFGQQRLWGTIGMGTMAIVSGALVDIYSMGLPEKDYLPAYICCFVLMLADMLVVAKIRIPYTSNQKLVIGDVGSTLLNLQVLVFLLTVYVIGTSLGIVWVFKLMLVEDVAMAWNSDFSALKLLQGLVLGIETFIGEIPFFFLSGMIIKRLGYAPVLSISLVATGTRCCLYSIVTNPWWFLCIEPLNGPSYSLFHSAMASYTSYIAPPGFQSTLQSIVRATFITGLSTAGILGGTLFSAMGGSAAFLHVGSFDLAYVLLYSLLHFLVNKYCTADKTTREPNRMTMQRKDEMDSFTGKDPEVAKELLVEKGCGGPMESVARLHEERGDECAKFD